MITAIELANAFVDRYAKSDYLTITKLNKLVYFAYARNLKRGEVLFSEPIQAWKSGPVILDVYYAYEKYGKNCIDKPVDGQISEKSYKVAEEIWQDFGKLTDWDLMELVHQKDSAWSKSYTDKCNVLISDDTILSSKDGVTPAFEGTFAEAAEIAFKELYPVLKMLADA